MIAIMIEQIFSAADTRRMAYPAGSAIFRQGMPTHAIFQVRTGAVEVVRHLADGSKVIIATAREGDTFAEAALFADHYHCDAIALTDCEVLSATTQSIEAALQREPQRARELAAFFSGQVRDLRSRLEILRIKRAPDRALAWLRARAIGDPPSVKPAGPWAGVANEIGLSSEALYRALRTLEVRGSIKRGEGRIWLRPS